MHLFSHLLCQRKVLVSVVIRGKSGGTPWVSWLVLHRPNTESQTIIPSTDTPPVLATIRQQGEQADSTQKNS